MLKEYLKIENYKINSVLYWPCFASTTKNIYTARAFSLGSEKVIFKIN